MALKMSLFCKNKYLVPINTETIHADTSTGKLQILSIRNTIKATLQALLEDF